MPVGELATRSPAAYSTRADRARAAEHEQQRDARDRMRDDERQIHQRGERPRGRETIRRASRYASGVPPRTPSSVAIVAVTAVSEQRRAQLARPTPSAATPRAPPDADETRRPAPRMNSRKSDAETATTTPSDGARDRARTVQRGGGATSER